MMYALSRSDLMYTKCVQNVCMQNVSHLSTKCCIQNEYKMYIYKIYITLRQTFVYILYTKFSWRSSFDFVYKMYTKVCRNMVCILYIFCRHQLYTPCTIFVYTKCIHSFRVGLKKRLVKVQKNALLRTTQKSSSHFFQKITD